MHVSGKWKLDLHIQIHMDWRSRATGSMLRWTLWRKGTMKASRWGLNSIVLPNLHARLLRNQRLPVLSAKKLTRGERNLPLLHLFTLSEVFALH